MNNQSKDFKKLQRLWYAKLKKKGFEDIEDDEDNLKVWESQKYVTAGLNQVNQTVMDAKQEYYRLAGAFLFEHKFQNDKERKVWELHADGLSYINIAKKLRSLDKNKVNKIVKDLAKIMVEKCHSTKKT